MSGLLPPPDTRPQFYTFSVVDVTVEPMELISTKNTRKECREFIKWREDADKLRIRRGVLKLFTK